MNGVCPICRLFGRLQCHHIVGRIRGIPIYPRLVDFICGPCNNVQYLLWQVIGIDDDEPTVAVELRRIASYLGISEDEFRRTLAEVLADLAERLENRVA